MELESEQLKQVLERTIEQVNLQRPDFNDSIQKQSFNLGIESPGTNKITLKAIILAGGFGTRIRKIVFDKPKSMIPIAGVPFLEHQIRLLKEQGVTEIILCVSYMADKIKSYFGDGRRIGVSITYSEEEVPLGTAGAIKRTQKYINDTFIVLNGDSYSHLNINDLIKFHKEKNSKGTICLTETKDTEHYGCVVLRDDKICEFAEKKIGEKTLINSGVYIFEPEIFNYIKENENISLEKQIFPILVKEGLLHGYRYEGYFIDIGRPETYTQFNNDVLNSLILKDNNTIKDALKKIDRSGIPFVVITDEQKRLLGTLTDKAIQRALVSDSGNINDEIGRIIIKNGITANINSSQENRQKLFETGISHLPIVDDFGIIRDIEFRQDEFTTKTFPILRGRAPLRISFAGGGTDLPYFFEKYGGAVVNATIDKYCYATIVKRADKKIIIDSDLIEETDIIVESLEDLKYDGKFDIIKAVIKLMKPDFGFELYLYNDIPPGRGLGSSASFAVLIASLLNNLMDGKLNDYKIAEIAYKCEREELKIKGGWQDQYATVTGGFNFMEFSSEKTIVYPLRLKEEVINELRNHSLLCFVGTSHYSSDIHQKQEEKFNTNGDEILVNLNRLKSLAIEIRDSLLTNHLEIFGKLLHESWEHKRKLSSLTSNSKIDILYETGLKHGAYGGRLLGAGNGGYILFFHQPKRRNELKKALEKIGGEITNFNFEFDGTKIWSVKENF
ncbi:MAG: sugar phosphate nucleotidyltransferase [Nanoarchaeota archaeon]|nr:sugar phosphate nucleotidyltransferase [Nanoarchaeota archaeon]